MISSCLPCRLIIPIIGLVSSNVQESGPIQHQSFPVPQDDHIRATVPPLLLRIQGNFTRITDPCVAIVPSTMPCTRANFGPVFGKQLPLHPSGPRVKARLAGPKHGPDAGRPLVHVSRRATAVSSCDAKVRWHESNLGEFLVFEVHRPFFTHPPNSKPSTVCYNQGNATPVALGELAYYPVPAVKFLSYVVMISVRSFLNPGWYQEVHLPCKNCSGMNRLVLKDISFEENCSIVHHTLPHWTHNKGVSRASKHPVHPYKQCKRRYKQPCAGYADDSFQSISPSDLSGSVASFHLKSQRRLLASERRHHFRHRSALCFYPDESSPKGMLVGYAQLRMDRADVNAFVAFVCFFGVALPLICMVTILLHANKIRRCKLQVRHLRTEYQRTQLEQEMISRREGGESDMQGV
eukprot:gnl/MRDRNA2_/MRDRNA2_58244_c0_seq1.p1 gnl/MRDRNA2_/MRDRNA2_58244_c0~~gnl/MRDRNA2_/MRDRNA2_58244_c0_seq1.p1  ORF type:complete len:437 (-),score=42.82 gnl/MRDRNA2_/MRDRNA2_58244_c0_seq1:44-1264(-)